MRSGRSRDWAPPMRPSGGPALASGMTGEDLARAALGLKGAPFRLHGRDPATGLDCIGLFAVAMARAGRPVALPNGYALRVQGVTTLTEDAPATPTRNR